MKSHKGELNEIVNSFEKKLSFTKAEMSAILHTAFLYEDLSELEYDLEKLYEERKTLCR